jgi:hypothetical protein
MPFLFDFCDTILPISRATLFAADPAFLRGAFAAFATVLVTLVDFIPDLGAFFGLCAQCLRFPIGLYFDSPVIFFI